MRLALITGQRRQAQDMLAGPAQRLGPVDGVGAGAGPLPPAAGPLFECDLVDLAAAVDFPDIKAADGIPVVVVPDALVIVNRWPLSAGRPRQIDMNGVDGYHGCGSLSLCPESYPAGSSGR